MAEKEMEFQDLIEEAIHNAREDRELAKEAFMKMREIYNISPEDPETFQAVMLIGQQTVKLIEAMGDANDQVIKAAALKQKEKPKVKEDEEDDGPVDVDELRRQMSGAH